MKETVNPMMERILARAKASPLNLSTVLARQLWRYLQELPTCYPEHTVADEDGAWSLIDYDSHVYTFYCFLPVNKRQVSFRIDVDDMRTEPYERNIEALCCPE